MFDKEKHYAGKTMKQLQAELKRFQDGLERSKASEIGRAAISFYTDHIAYLKLKIAERIGRK